MNNEKLYWALVWFAFGAFLLAFGHFYIGMLDMGLFGFNAFFYGAEFQRHTAKRRRVK